MPHTKRGYIMKNFKRISVAFLLIISMLVTVIPFSAEVSAATLTYSKSSNSGTRNVVCTTLDGTSAASYYTGNYTYEKLANLSSNSLFTTLQTLMRTTHNKTSSYNDCRDMADQTDCENENGRVTLIYTSYSATMSQYNGWNREHVWPQSLGGGNTSGGGADLHHIRPSDAGVNSSRGNKKYGNSNGGTAKYGSNPATGVLGGHYSSSYFEPLDNVKGDVARICLYVYVRWNSQWGAESITEVFQSVDVLLEWMEMDPVDTWEMGRNEVVANYQGNRNVFIDYPELAWIMLGYDVPEGLTTPSGNGSNGSSGGNQGGNTGNQGGNTGNQGGNTGDQGGNTGSQGGNTGNQGGTTTPPTTTPDYVVADSIQAGKEYLLAMLNNGETLYFDGSIPKSAQPWYFGASSSASDALPVQLETVSGVSGGYRLYCMKDGKKTYLRLYERSDKAGSGTMEMTTTCPSEYYTYDSTYKTLVHTFADGETKMYIGTYGTFNTFGASKYSYIGNDDSWIGRLYVENASSGGNQGGGTTVTCQHTTTEIRNASSATCGKNGYTGDTYCKSCNTKIKGGSTITATGNHSYGQWTVNGNQEERTCSVCQNVETRPLVTCEHKNTELREKVNATCGKDGYTGDTCCKDCNAIIAYGEQIPATGNHTFGGWATNGANQVRKCVNCEKSETRLTPTCNHGATEITGATEPTCSNVGYTGDSCCVDCGTIIKKGEEIPRSTEHKNTELRYASSTTCVSKGYTGDLYCNDCNAKIEDGKTIPASGVHSIVSEIISEPTKKDDGLRMDKCEHCDFFETVVLPKTGSNNTVIIIIIVSAAVVLAAVVVTVIVIKKKKAK